MTCSVASTLVILFRISSGFLGHFWEAEKEAAMAVGMRNPVKVQIRETVSRLEPISRCNKGNNIERLYIYKELKDIKVAVCLWVLGCNTGIPWELSYALRREFWSIHPSGAWPIINDKYSLIRSQVEGQHVFQCYRLCRS